MKLFSTLSVVLNTVILCLLIERSLAEDYKCECGKPKDVFANRIIGGIAVAPHAFPWIVSMMKGDTIHCGAALLTDRHVITAGHCLKWTNTDSITLYIGMHSKDLKTESEKRTIAKSTIHPDFTSNEVRDIHDIAIIELNSPITFNEKMYPICLPPSGQDYVNVTGTISGWGKTLEAKRDFATMLRATKVRVMSYDRCKLTRLKDYLHPTMLCAFAKGKDGCQGDSGGPLFVLNSTQRYELAGLISWGVGCGRPQYPGVYTKVSAYNDWIDKLTTAGKKC